MSLKLIWITDPWNTLDHPLDTSLRLIQEASELGVPQFWCDVKTIRLENFQVLLDASPITSISPKRDLNSFRRGPLQVHSPCHFDCLNYRTDPPIDQAYLHPLQLLSLGLQNERNHEVVNPLEVLFSLNEKIEAAALGNLMPASLVSSQWERLLSFGKCQERTVLKPLHQAQSQGIELLDWRSAGTIEDAKSKLEIATSNFNYPIMLQKYLEGIIEGEVRLWFLDGNLLAYAKKLPVTGDFRVNIDRGSQLALHTLSENEKSVVDQVAKHLKLRKIRLAAVDLIEGLITDFNFTSPGLITQMEDLLSENLARPIIRALTQKST